MQVGVAPLAVCPADWIEAAGHVVIAQTRGWCEASFPTVSNNDVAVGSTWSLGSADNGSSPALNLVLDRVYHR